MGNTNLGENGNKQATQLVLVLNVSLAADSQEALLRVLATANGSAAPAKPVAEADVIRCPDPWLSLREAAQHLGVSTNTLYKYACQRRVESRKLGGRLQFRRSALDRFMESQIRPERGPTRPRSIMPLALSSGK